MMDECRKRLRKVGRKGVGGSSSDFYFASLDGNLVLDAGERPSAPWRRTKYCCLPHQSYAFLSPQSRVALSIAKQRVHAVLYRLGALARVMSLQHKTGTCSVSYIGLRGYMGA